MTPRLQSWAIGLDHGDTGLANVALYRPPEGTAMALAMPPRLESWDAKAAPSQLALGRYLDHVVELTRERLAKLGAGAAMRFRPRGQTRAPVGGVRPDPRNVDRSHPWRQWKPGQLRTKLRVPRSELA